MSLLRKMLSVSSVFSFTIHDEEIVTTSPYGQFHVSPTLH